MSKTLGIDLGTNSIGLAIRNENEFDWFGVYTFKKGVGFGKTGEFSFAAQRTKHRSSRRLYNARRYRKWTTLKVLIENDFCPLHKEELHKWSHYEKGIGRIFPIHSIAFNNWIKLDFNDDGKVDYSSPYQLRRELINNKLDLNKSEDRYKIGRALYHIAQRRGFKSSRKSGDSEKTSVNKGSNETRTIGLDEYKELIVAEGSLGAAFATLEDKGIRIRNRYTLRNDYYKEVELIAKEQQLGKDFTESILKAIFYQRPLRSQKGLVGKCTLENNKYRCPISHPKFEIFRAWSFINTIKYKDEETSTFEPIPYDLKESIFSELFFRKSKAHFKFEDIRNFIEKNGGKQWQLNYKKKLDNTNIEGCPVSARLKAVFGDNWETVSINKVRKNKRGETKNVKYKLDDIWHILFTYEDEEVFQEFLIDILELNDEQCKEMMTLWNSFPVGYASLSLHAICNILPFLEQGLIYTEATLLAKIPKIIGIETFNKNKELLLKEIRNVININRAKKDVVNITNNLISKYKSLDWEYKYAYKDNSYKIDELDLKDIKQTVIRHFGKKKWDSFRIEYQESIINEVGGNYQEFFYSSNRDYIKQPHLLNQIKHFLKEKFNLSDEKLLDMYHPSQIDIYPKYDDQVFLKSPKTAAFKNPMAYKTLHRLREVINYLIEVGKIDNETKVIVEVARELNDANKRNAIETYQRRREAENKEFAIAISELTKDPDFEGRADPNNKDDKDKFRLWTEQLENREEVLRSITTTKEDVRKYRLWKEQNCQCIYTGRVINITDLFNPNVIDFEHTIPRSKSFDNSLANLTVCYADYNRNIKKNQIPTELPNYKVSSNGYPAIEPWLEKWKNKIESLNDRIATQVRNSKIAKDKKAKDEAIVRRHILKEELKYWQNKVDRFTREDIPQGFVNSQLRDTQIITKYAYHYLKTVFNKVEVQKGSITAEFRRIYQIQEKDEIKSRDKHHHHAIDAAVLTLIPDSAKREEILKRAYDYEELTKKQYHEEPFKGFKQNIITGIDNTILINNMANQDQALSKGKKVVRSRGKIVWLRDVQGKIRYNVNGDKIPKIAQGDSIRGQLHQETFYGKIKVVKREDDGKPIRNENGDWLYESKNDGFRYVVRIPIEKLSKLDQLVDPYIAKMIEKQLNGRKLSEAISEGVFMLDKKGERQNRIRRVRTWVRSTSLLSIKKQTYPSKSDYKNYYWADTGDNYAFALYVSKDGKKKIVARNLFEISGFSSGTKLMELFEKSIDLTKSKKANLHHVFQVGQKVIFYEKDKNEIKELDLFSNRLYYVHTLFSSDDGRIRFQHHLESRNDERLQEAFPKETFGVKGKNGFSKFSTDFIQPRLLISPANLNCIIENVDFKFHLDGSIEFLY